MYFLHTLKSLRSTSLSCNCKRAHSNLLSIKALNRLFTAFILRNCLRFLRTKPHILRFSFKRPIFQDFPDFLAKLFKNLVYHLLQWSNTTLFRDLLFQIRKIELPALILHYNKKLHVPLHWRMTKNFNSNKRHNFASIGNHFWPKQNISKISVFSWERKDCFSKLFLG